MKLNYETALVAEKVVLVPYRPEHVPRYHEWMKDPDLLEATGSEPLSLEEEIKMQESWRDDPEKCTFIVHARDNCDYHDDSPDFLVTKHLPAMVGDVNLFLSEIETDEDNGTAANENLEKDNPPALQAEIDIMIAEKDHHRRGLGKAATCSMLLYGAQKLHMQRFFCKINEDNTASINLFKSLGFSQCDYAACFKQVELELCKSNKELEEELGIHGSYKEAPCPI